MKKTKTVLPLKTSSISSSGDGFNFEHSVQAFFVVQMVMGGLAPRMGNRKIVKVVLQSDRLSRSTDDCEITLLDEETGLSSVLLVQVKRAVNLTPSNKDFTETIRDAWKDYNSQNFNKAEDKIMLVTGDLDGNGAGLKSMLTYMHSIVLSTNFWRDYRAGLTGRGKKELNGFQRLINNIEKANGGTMPEDERIFDFCKSFIIIKTDLHENDLAVGDINLTLIHSILSAKTWKNSRKPQEVWERLHAYISNQNKNQIAIHVDNLQEKLLDIFAEDKIVAQQSLDHTTNPVHKILNTAIDTQHEKELALLCLIGQFDSANPNDVEIISGMFGDTHDQSLRKIQSISNDNSNALQLVGTTWKVAQPLDTLTKLGEYIFDNDIDHLESIYLKVLQEIDPALGLPPEERHMASFHNKHYTYSKSLRSGLSNSMAMIANNPKILKRCASDKVAMVSVMSVRKLLENYESADVWASLTEHASTLAQTAPDDFLSILEKTLKLSKNNPFQILSSESSGDPFFQKDYISSFRWALADLAWISEFFTRAIFILSKLSSLEVVAVNKQNHALDTILHTILPWRPQTLASTEVRYRVVEQIIKNDKKAGLVLLKQLLPNVTQTSVEREWPSWLMKPSAYKANEVVTTQDVWSQSSYYSLLYVKTIKSTDEIVEAIHNINHLTEDAVLLLTAKIEKSYPSYSERKLHTIWSALVEFNSDTGRRPTPKHLLANNGMVEIQRIIKILEPSDPIERYARLFSHYDHELMDTKDWKKGEEQIRLQRQDALINSLKSKTTSELSRLIDISKMPEQLGSALGYIKYDNLDELILPTFIRKNEAHKKVASAFIYSRFFYNNQTVEWVKEINFDSWKDDLKVTFLLSLPFKKTVWDLVKKQSSYVNTNYWKSIEDFRPMHNEGYSEYAVARLLNAKRPLAALNCIYWSSFVGENKGSINLEQTLATLLESVSTQEDVSVSRRLHYELSEIIEYLQKNTDFTKTDLWKVEWAYLPLFSKGDNHQPLSLIYLIANDAEFFCSLVQMGYKSKTSNESKRNKISDRVQNNLLKLLSFNDFPIMPGVDEHGKMVKNNFKKWMAQSINTCRESGHLEVALSIIGSYLINAPADPLGLWIDKSVAQYLDEEDFNEIREGFNTGIYNSRGIHSVDPTGTDEANLRDYWAGRADKVEESGFLNFAISLRKLSSGFERDRNRVINRSTNLED